PGQWVWKPARLACGDRHRRDEAGTACLSHHFRLANPRIDVFCTCGRTTGARTGMPFRGARAWSSSERLRGQTRAGAECAIVRVLAKVGGRMTMRSNRMRALLIMLAALATMGVSVPTYAKEPDQMITVNPQTV